MRFTLYISLLFAWLPPYTATSETLPDSTTGSGGISASYLHGFLIAHRPSLVPLQQNHANGFELCISKQTTGNKVWQRLYNYPSIGLKYQLLNTGNPEQIGRGHAIIPYIDFVFGKNLNAQLHLMTGFGLGYIEKPFDVKNNYKNIAIGSHLNGIINASVQFKIKVFQKFYTDAGLNLTHFSNGSITVPNLGINIITLKGGITYYVGTSKKIVREPAPSFEKKYRNSVYLAGAVKQIYPVMGADYYAVILSAARLKQLSARKAIGVGADVHYDSSIKFKISPEGGNDKFTTGIRAGLNGSYEMIISDFSLLIQMGGYLYNNAKSDGTIYQRLGTRYQFTRNYFACVNLKTHWAKADFFEWGFGIKF